MMRGYGFNSGYGMGGGGLALLLMLVFWLVLVAGVVLLVVWAVRSTRHHGAPGAPVAHVPGHDEAVAIARRRLASGEITKDQFEEIMTTLGS